MAIVKQVVGARTAIASANLPTLASAAYATSSTKDNTGNQPIDLLVELSITPGTVSGNKQAILFALASLNGSTFQTGANVTDAGDMTPIGVLPLASNNVTQTKLFSVAGQYGGNLPPYLNFVVLNDSGAAFSAGTIFVSEVSATVV
jgi:hypothetical protein